MDFLSKIIKRPHSIATMSDAKASSDTPTAPASSEISVAAAPAMDLENLLDSASQDLDTLEEQHQQLLDAVVDPVDIMVAEAKPSTPRETIKQLLCDINVNLDQVTTNEMEHLQAMSLELNPLAVKTTPRSSSMEQQKALFAAAMRSTSQPGTPTANSSCDPLRFTGLPEFDETQIPELAPFGADMEAQLKADSSALGRLSYHSDSDVYAECLSLESVKMSAEQSELEAYSSALNEVLEQQSSSNLSTATTLENTLSEADAALAAVSTAASSVHDNSCEPMDVDDISETMEMLKDVLEPEDHRMLQQQFLGAAVDTVKQGGTNSNVQLAEPLQQQEEPQSPKVAMPAAQQITSPPIPTHRPKTAEELSEQIALQQFDLPDNEQAEIKPAKQEDEIQKQENKPVQQEQQQVEQEQKSELPVEREQETELVVQKEQVQQKAELPIEQFDERSIKEESENIATQQGNKEELVKEYVELKQEVQPLTGDNFHTPLEPAEQQHSQHQQSQHQQLPELTPLSLSMSSSTNGRGSAPSSPSFPIKQPAEAPSHFPRSPHAPREQVEEVYLEEAVIEPSLDRKLSLGGVIARDPLPIELTITEPSPEKPHEQQQQVLNETLPMSNESPLNGTFNHATSEAPDQPSISSAAFGVPLEASMDKSQQRRTFSLNFTRDEEQHHQHSEDELPMNNTYAMPLNAVKEDQRRTFSLADQQQPDPDQVKSRRTFHLEQAQQTRHTFNADPQRHATTAIEAAEDEPMDVDLSLRVDTATDPSQFAPLSPPIPTHQVRAEPPSSPPIPTHQANVRVQPPSSPPLPTHKAKEQYQNIPSQEQPREVHSPPLPTHQPKVAEQIQDSHSPPLPTHLRDTRSPPIPTLQQKQQLKRPSIHGDRLCPNATVVLEEQTLSAKEQLSASNEKDDVLVEHFGAMSPITDDIFKSPQFTSSAFNNLAKEKAFEVSTAVPKAADNEEQFQSGAIILNSSDFDYLYTKGHNNAPIDRSSLLLKFDPLLGAPVPVNHQQFQQQEQKLLNVLSNNNNNNLPRALSPTLEEHETSGSNQSFVIEPSAKGGRSQAGGPVGSDYKFKPPVDRTKKHAKMSVDVIDNDCNKTFDNSNLNLEEKTHKYHNMDELEKKIKNEVTRSEDIEKKLKEAELREEALVKRITEKDKTNSKLNNVIEAYEKAIAELIHDKEQLVQDHEREMLEVQADRDSNYHHLTSLETTFSDLHVKYEKSKEMTSQLKKNEECLQEEKRKLMDKLRQQEQRYEQMRSHAMQQMEIANKKLATLTKDHADEVKKLKALLKKEEVSRISTAEQLQQKSRENADLLKICEDLIYDKGQGGSS